MRNINNLAKKLAVVAAAAALCGTSAIAETRHHDETRGDSRSGRVERSDRGGRSERQPSEQQRSFDRSQQRQFEQRSSQNWNRDNRGSRDFHDNSRSVATENWRGRGNNGNYFREQGRIINNSRGYRGTPYHYHGRITRYEPWNGGFRVWLGGAPYPFFVPYAYYRSHGLRIGLSIGLGGYYNPLGYYDYYDDPYYYGSPAPVASGDIRGVVESVDYRRGTLVIRDDYSGQFVTAVMRGRDRTFDQLRPGDYVELGGDWVRGTFEAYRADFLNNRYDDRGRY